MFSFFSNHRNTRHYLSGDVQGGQTYTAPKYLEEDDLDNLHGLDELQREEESSQEGVFESTLVDREGISANVLDNPQDYHSDVSSSGAASSSSNISSTSSLEGVSNGAEEDIFGVLDSLLDDSTPILEEVQTNGLGASFLDSSSRSNIELYHFFNLKAETLISVSRNIRLDVAFLDYFYWLDKICDSFNVGSATFFRAITLFHQVLDINERQIKWYTLEQYLSACLMLACYIEEDSIEDYIDFSDARGQPCNAPQKTFFRQYLANSLKCTAQDLSNCMRSILNSLKHDLYHVEDIYDCYIKNFFSKFDDVAHQQLSFYLAVIRCDCRFTQFGNKMILSALSQCLFNDKILLVDYILEDEIFKFEACKKMLSWLIYQLPIDIILTNTQGKHLSLAKVGISFGKLSNALFSRPRISSGLTLLDVLPKDFINDIREKDECLYQLLSSFSAAHFSSEVQLTLLNDTVSKNFILSWFDSLSKTETRQKILSLSSHIISTKCEAAYRSSILYDYPIPSPSPHVNDGEGETKDEEQWEFVSSFRK